MDESAAPPQHPSGGGDHRLVLLRGGVRDGQRTHVAEGVTRLLTPSEAPGLIDVYERVDDVAGAEGVAQPGITVFELVDQRSAEGVAPELLHMPGDSPVPGST